VCEREREREREREEIEERERERDREREEGETETETGTKTECVFRQSARNRVKERKRKKARVCVRVCELACRRGVLSLQPLVPSVASPRHVFTNVCAILFTPPVCSCVPAPVPLTDTGELVKAVSLIMVSPEIGGKNSAYPPS
jgi:hypothetical protein